MILDSPIGEAHNLNIFSILQNTANRDSLLNKKNKSIDNVSPKKSSDSNVNNQMKNDTYESVCSPEDVAERMRTAQKHSVGSILTNSSGAAGTALKRIEAKGTYK